MSASASKKRRQMLNEQGLTPKQLAEAKEKEEQKKKRTPIIVFCVVALVAVALVLTLALVSSKQTEARLDELYSPSYDITTVAATVGDYQITVPVYNYFYSDIVNSNATLYSYFYGLQTDVPFAEQKYTEDQTFEDLFIEQTNNSVEQYLSLYAEAKDNGYELTSEDNAAIEESIKSVRESARLYGFPKVDYYLYEAIGEGCNEQNYREYLELRQTVAGYVAKTEATFEPSDEDITKEYAANPDSYDVVNYTLFTVNAEGTEVEHEADEDNDETHTHTEYSDEALAKAKQDAEAAEKSFPADDATAGYGNLSTLTSRFNEEAAEWLFDSARKQGDTKAFAVDENGQSYRVLCFGSRDTNDYHRVNAYVVSISTTATGGDNGELTAEDIVNNITSGISQGMSDEAFETLVSDNGYSATSTAVSKNSYNEDITNFLFSDSRVAGDYELFTTESSYYIVRFQSVADELYRVELVRSALHDATEEEWFNGVYESHTVTIDDAALVNANTNMTLHSSN